MKRGTRNLITDVPGLYVGNAQDDRLKSGVTVMVGDRPFVAAAHVMGGAPGSRETDLLAAEQVVETIDALVLAGGSAFGLDAASGVADSLHRAGIGFPVGPARVPLVPAAILFDLLNGGDKRWKTNPYPALGAAALSAAQIDFALGSVGAGTGATIADLKGGLGSASVVLDSGHTVGALVAVNAHGSTNVPERPHFWAAPFEVGDEFGGLGVCVRTAPLIVPHSLKMEAFSRAGAKHGAGTNTTIAIVATDAVLTKAQAKRLAIAAHDGMARALVPAHTPFDGDLVFAAATCARALADPPMDTLLIGHAAALCLSRAIARAVHSATAAAGDILPTWSRRWDRESDEIYPD
ncbi:MAG: P1 family peptidase [Lautropia sp.]